jgi:hypothetical protein
MFQHEQFSTIEITYKIETYVNSHIFSSTATYVLTR